MVCACRQPPRGSAGTRTGPVLLFAPANNGTLSAMLKNALNELDLDDTAVHDALTRTLVALEQAARKVAAA